MKDYLYTVTIRNNMPYNNVPSWAILDFCRRFNLVFHCDASKHTYFLYGKEIDAMWSKCEECFYEQIPFNPVFMYWSRNFLRELHWYADDRYPVRVQIKREC